MKNYKRQLRTYYHFLIPRGRYLHKLYNCITYRIFEFNKHSKQIYVDVFTDWYISENQNYFVT